MMTVVIQAATASEVAVLSEARSNWQRSRKGSVWCPSKVTRTVFTFCLMMLQIFQPRIETDGWALLQLQIVIVSFW